MEKEVIVPIHRRVTDHHPARLNHNQSKGGNEKGDERVCGLMIPSYEWVLW